MALHMLPVECFKSKRSNLIMTTNLVMYKKPRLARHVLLIGRVVCKIVICEETIS